MAKLTVNDLQVYINEHDPTNHSSAAQMLALAQKVDQEGGLVPHTRKALKAMQLDENIAGLLMQDVFGATDIVVGTHGRKIVTALDMFDWEEYADKKVDIKMAKIPPHAVKKSLKMWIPKGEAGNFHGIMNSLGSILARVARKWEYRNIGVCCLPRCCLCVCVVCVAVRR